MTRLVDDRALLEGFRRGEAAALAEVYREYARPLFALLSRGFVADGGASFRGFRERWAVEEAAQEIFARAFAERARLAYDGLHPYRNYLFTIARNHVIDLLRVRGREVAMERPPEAAPEPGAPVPAEESAASRELARRCQAFVDGLAPDERALFEARFREGLSIEQTARRLGISEHHAKRGEARLKKRFFVTMKQHGYFDGLAWGKGGPARLPLWALLLLGVGA